ncbi:uncharacterized protein [Triticum aestivum]|uniref:uncharacterized protein n=1 Tax=Triticum aestivum TaxID=4565 RepID=UPI001D005851|nr:uncharacterized protein LOC123046160 [Triticum aestivum]
MALGGCSNEADGARANHEGSSTGQRHQHGGRPLVWEGNGTANRSGSGDQDANGSGSQRPWKGITMLCLVTRCLVTRWKWFHLHPGRRCHSYLQFHYLKIT